MTQVFYLRTTKLMWKFTQRKPGISSGTRSALNQLARAHASKNQLNRRNQLNTRNQQTNKRRNNSNNKNWVHALPNVPKPVTPNSSYQRLITTNRAKRIYNRLMKTSHAQHPQVYWVAYLTDRWNVHNPYKNYNVNEITSMSNTDFSKLWRKGLELYKEEQGRLQRAQRVR